MIGILGILVIYLIGKRFYDLAVEYDQNKWLFAILSVVIYYASGAIFGVIIVLLDLFVFDWGIDWENNIAINLLGLPVGLLAVWGMYVFLENRWKKVVKVVKDEIHEIGKPQED